MADLHALLQDPRIEAVLERAYREWKAQRRQLVWRFLPLLPRLLTKRRLDWQDMFARTRDMYLPLEYMADPRNGFRAIVLSLKDGTEVAVYTGRPGAVGR